MSEKLLNTDHERLQIETSTSKTRVKAIHVIILGGLGAFGPLSTDLYLPALPSVSRDLATTVSQAQITLSACILGLALGQVVAGPLSDRLGRRPPLLAGIIAFIVTSVLCAFAPSVEVFTGLRFLQGTAGAAGIAIALAIASDLYSGVALARCFALLTMVNALAPILAPVIGSQLLTFTSWPGIFVALALFGFVLLVAAFVRLSESLPAERRQSGGLANTLGTFGNLLADRRFVGYTLTSSFTFTAAIIYISISPFVLQNIYGLSPQLFGLVFGFNALGLAALSQVSARLVGRISPRVLLGWGVGLLVTGSIGLLVVVLSEIGLAGVLVAFFVIVASLGLIAPNATTLALSRTETAGSASALLGVLQLSIGPLVAPIVGLGGTATAIPLAIGIGVFSLAALATYSFLARPA